MRPLEVGIERDQEAREDEDWKYQEKAAFCLFTLTGVKQCSSLQQEALSEEVDAFFQTVSLLAKMTWSWRSVSMAWVVSPRR